MKNKFVHWFVIIIFVFLYAVVSIISTIHVIDFFELSNPKWLAVSLAIAFEIGAAASLAAIIVLTKMSKFLVWALFFVLTAMQMMGNTYFAYTHVHDFQSWIELFGLDKEPLITQKRILAIVSGAILPVVALGFIKSLVDYIRPSEGNEGDVRVREKKKNNEEEDFDKPIVKKKKVKENIEEDFDKPIVKKKQSTKPKKSGVKPVKKVENVKPKEDKSLMKDVENLKKEKKVEKKKVKKEINLPEVTKVKQKPGNIIKELDDYNK